MPHDERLALPLGQAALLWCMRAWVVSQSRPLAAGHRIPEVLDSLGAPDAAAPIEGFMAALEQGAARTLGVDCLCKPRVSEDERALLNIVALVQHNRPLEALLMLREMLTPEGAHAALGHAGGLGTALARAGRMLPAPDEPVQRFTLAGASALH